MITEKRLILDIEPLNKKEIIDNFNKMKAGDSKAREKIIVHNIKLVGYRVYKRFAKSLYDKDELFSVGIVGLIKSVDTFDVNKSVAFQSYAIRCIDNEILMYIRDNKKFLKNKSFEQEICDNFKIKDTLVDTNSDFVFNYEQKEMYLNVRKIVEQLPDSEKQIVMLYFGFFDKRYKQREIAKLLGISQASVSKLIKKIVGEIAYNLNEQYDMYNLDEVSKNYVKQKRKTFK